MKKIALFLASISAFAQSTSFYTWNLQVSPADTAVPVSTTLDAAVALANYLFHNSVGQTTLTAACGSAATTCTVASVSGIVANVTGICFSAPCGLTATATGGPPPTSFSLSSGEVALVTAISGNTLTLKRASIGTAVSATAGQAVTILAAGSYSVQTSQFIAAATAPIVQNCNNGAYTAVNQCAAISAAQSALAGVH